MVAVFPKPVSCGTIQSWARPGVDVCESVQGSPHFFIVAGGASVKSCANIDAAAETVKDKCVDFQVIAKLQPASWYEGTLDVGVGVDHHGRLVIDGTSFEGGVVCSGSARECVSAAQDWANRITP